MVVQGIQGHLDTCWVCKLGGALDLCAKCPRGYHPACLKDDERKGENNPNWECPWCVKARKIRRAEDAKTPIQRQEDDAVVSNFKARELINTCLVVTDIRREKQDTC